jgi:hypothetical protein
MGNHLAFGVIEQPRSPDIGFSRVCGLFLSLSGGALLLGFPLFLQVKHIRDHEQNDQGKGASEKDEV